MRITNRIQRSHISQQPLTVGLGVGAGVGLGVGAGVGFGVGLGVPDGKVLVAPFEFV